MRRKGLRLTLCWTRLVAGLSGGSIGFDDLVQAAPTPLWGLLRAPAATLLAAGAGVKPTRAGAPRQIGSIRSRGLPRVGARAAEVSVSII